VWNLNSRKAQNLIIVLLIRNDYKICNFIMVTKYESAKNNPSKNYADPFDEIIKI
jgi:hypothetical protein